MPNQTEVLIIGAGPTGLAMALWLTAQKVRVRIIDKALASVTTSRALAVQARTLELYQQLDLADAVLNEGHVVSASNIWAGDHFKAHVPLSDIGKGLTPFPCLFVYPQDKHERMLEEKLATMGVHVQRQVELIGFTESGEGVSATLRGKDGQDEVCTADYIVGCDGGHSVVRHVLDIGFEGGTYPQLFFVADVEGTGHVFNGEVHMNIGGKDILGVFSLDGVRSARLVGSVSGELAEKSDSLTFDDIKHRTAAEMKINVEKVNWFSTYSVHHRVANKFRKGRAFLVGDAGHIHSPAGGQGMNTGIGDAINLAWKLASVLHGKADDTLLDTYEAERRAFALTLVSTTDQVFSMLTSNGIIANVVRKHIVPFFAPIAVRLPFLPGRFFRMLSQFVVNYRYGPLSEGFAGYVHGGDRLPWAVANGVDNFSSLAISWQVHVYGTASDDMVQWCEDKNIPLHVFPWDPVYNSAGLVCDAAYLLRPDTYIGAIDQSGSPGSFEHYFSDRGVKLDLRE